MKLKIPATVDYKLGTAGASPSCFLSPVSYKNALVSFHHGWQRTILSKIKKFQLPRRQKPNRASLIINWIDEESRIGEMKRMSNNTPGRNRPFKSTSKQWLGKFENNFNRYSDYLQLDKNQVNIAGVFTLARGGSNFICSRLHYFPDFFSVSERVPTYKRINFEIFR